jgi:predicted alpha/beta-fold hydrolase
LSTPKNAKKDIIIIIMAPLPKVPWTIEAYCQRQHELQTDWSHLPQASHDFVNALQLPSLHPFCQFPILSSYDVPGVPRQGPLLHGDHFDNWREVVLAWISMGVPSVTAILELWLRLIALLLAPLGIVLLLWHTLQSSTSQPQPTRTTHHKPWLSVLCCMTVASSLVLMTDTGYINEFGPLFGTFLFGLAVALSLQTAWHHHLFHTGVGILCLCLLATHLVYEYESGEFAPGHVPELYGPELTSGTYYDTNNPRMLAIVQAWPMDQRIYDWAHGATVWQPSGDARTGLPFVMNRVPQAPRYIRVWCPTLHDDEVVALDIAFPDTGHSTDRPVYLVLHGLNGGSHEEFVMDFVHRRNKEGSTVVVMVARGLQDLPVRGWNVFHGARVTDAHAAARAIRHGLVPGQVLGGVGYSMGAIILNNYVARYGNDCALDAAVSVSGGLDMRREADFVRAQRLWQPVLCATLRNDFVLGKWGERVRARLTREQMKDLMRATHVTDIDKTAVVAYNGFRDIEHYYGEMSALGDVTAEEYAQNEIPRHRRIHNVSIPLCIIHALDDPLVTWRTVAAKEGIFHPSNLVKTGSGNLVILLTNGGGHVGWPVGLLPQRNRWKWMHDAASSFILAVDKVQKEKTMDGDNGEEYERS